VEGFGRVRPEIELHVGVVGSLNGARLLRVDEVGELDGVLNEENRGVVSYHVVVSFFSVELDSETTGISHGIGGSSLTGNSGESEEARGALLGVEEVSLGKHRNVVGHFKVSVSSSALGVDDSLGNSLSVEVS